MTISHREFREVACGKRTGVATRMPRRKPQLPPDLHARKCTICRHPNRQEIEAAFLRWCSPAQIALEHNIASRRNIYRHVHATGLYAHRQMRLRCAAEIIIERVDNVTPNAHGVLRAIEACCHINDRGQWCESRPRAPGSHDLRHAKNPSPASDRASAKQNVVNRGPHPRSSPETPLPQQDASATASQSPASDLELEPGLNLKISGKSVRLKPNRQFLTRLETDANG